MEPLRMPRKLFKRVDQLAVDITQNSRARAKEEEQGGRSDEWLDVSLAALRPILC